MLFGNGCWLQKEGCACFTPQEVYFENTEATKVTLCLPTSRIVNRGCTLGGINLTMVITSPAPDVLRVQTYHHLGVKKREPEFELYQKEEQPLTVTSDEEKLTVTSGGLTLEIGKKNWYMAYRRGNEVITRSAAKDLACMKTDWKGDAYDKGDGTETYMRQQLTMGVGELIYGLGERFTAFTKNGQSVAIWNEDGGTSTYQSYKNIPFYISNKGYGVFVNHPEKVEFEIGTEQVTKTAFSVEGGCLDYYLFNGPSMKEVLERYTDLTGKPSLPAPWTFGLWLSTSFTTNYDEETVMSFVDGMLDRGIPLRTFHFDCFWMKEFHWTDFVWDSRVFPDPKGMLSRIKAKGLNICVWINPYIAQESCLFAEGMEKGYFVKRTNGDVWQWDMWQPGMALVDFTNPDACTWYQEKLAGLLDMGVDCFKTDFGERIPVDGIEYFDHSDAKKMHNYYTGMALCGGCSYKDVSGLGDLPFWIIHGTADRAVPVKQSKVVVDKLVKDGKDTRLIYDWWKGANHGTPARVFYLKKTYQWLFSHSLLNKDRPVNRNISITMSDLGRAYGDVNRNAPQPELIDGPSVIKQEGNEY